MLDAVPVGPEAMVNTYTDGSQRQAVVAADAAGNYVIVWRSIGQDGDGAGVYARLYDAAGRPRGDEIRVNTYTQGDQRHPAIAMSPGGDFMIAWASAPLPGQVGQDGSDVGVFAQRYDQDGVPLGGEFQVNTQTEGKQAGDFEGPSVAMDATGTFVVAWTNQPGNESSSDVAAQRFNLDGQAIGDEFIVNAVVEGRQNSPSVACDLDGDFIVTWQDYLGSLRVLARRFTSDGLPVGSNFEVASTTAAGDPAAPKVAMDADGDFTVVWSTAYDQFIRHYDRFGAPKGARVRLNAIAGSLNVGRAFQGRVTTQPNGTSLAVWTWRGLVGSSFESNVMARVFGPTGASLGGEFPVNSIVVIGPSPSVATNDRGDVVFSFATPSPSDIFARRFTTNPRVDASSFRFASAPHELRFSFNHDASATLGTEDLLVQNLTTGQTVPSGAFALTYDLATNTAALAYTGTTGGITGMLPDGQYRATILAAGTALETDYSTEFLFMQGDANNDGRVNLADFNVLASNFGQSPRDFTQGDFNYDGQVNLADFNILAGRFGVALAPSTSTLSTFGFGRHLGAEEEAEPDLLA